MSPSDDPEIEGEAPTDEVPLFVALSPRTGCVTAGLLGFGCLGVAVFLLIGYAYAVISAAGLRGFDALAPLFGVAVFAGLGVVFFLGMSNVELRRFVVHRDRVEVEGSSSDRSAHIAHGDIRHFELRARGHIAFRHRRADERCFTEYVIAAGRLHAEDRFDEWMELVEVITPAPPCSIRHRGAPVFYSRTWRWDELYPGDETVSAAAIEGCTATLGDRRYAVSPGAPWRIWTDESRDRVLLRGTRGEVATGDGLVLAEVSIEGGERRVRFGDGGELRIRFEDGVVTCEGEAIGRFPRPFTRHRVDFDRPLPAFRVLTLLAVECWPGPG